MVPLLVPLFVCLFVCLFVYVGINQRGFKEHTECFLVSDWGVLEKVS